MLSTIFQNDMVYCVYTEEEKSAFAARVWVRSMNRDDFYRSQILFSPTGRKKVTLGSFQRHKKSRKSCIYDETKIFEEIFPQINCSYTPSDEIYLSDDIYMMHNLLFCLCWR